MLWDHIEHYKLLENSHGHHVIPQEFHFDLLLINIHWLYFKVLLLCHTTGCYTNHKCYPYSYIYLSADWLKCDLSHNTFLVWNVTLFADLTLPLSQAGTQSITLSNYRASECRGESALGGKCYYCNLKRGKKKLEWRLGLFCASENEL